MAAVLLILVIIFAAAIYLRGATHGRARPVWRICSLFLGLLAIWIAMVSPAASMDGRMLTAHMIQHLLLMTFAPPLIWLGEPLIMVRARPWPLPRDLRKVLGHPAFCWLASAAALIVWHVPAIFRLGMESPTWHFIEHGSFLVTGLLFWWPVIQPWPSVAVWPRWSMLPYLFLATVPCDVISGLLVFSGRIVYPVYLSMPRMGGLSALEDQQCAAALMWTCVTVVFMVAGAIIAMELLSPKLRAQEAVSV